MTANKILFHFYSSDNFFAKLIKIKTNSKINHVALEIPDIKFFIEAKATKGVIKAKTTIKKPEFTIEAPFNTASKKGKEYIRFLKRQVGKKYDWKVALFGFFGVKHEDTNGWVCSLLIDTYFTVYLKLISKIQTNVSPKVFLAKIEAFLQGYNHEK